MTRTLIKDGTVVTASDTFAADVWIENGKIAALVQNSGWTQATAAKHCRISQPRMNDLLRGRISRFSLDALVNIATSLGQHVRIELEAA